MIILKGVLYIKLGFDNINYKNINDYEEFITEMSYDKLNDILEKFTEQFDEYQLSVAQEIRTIYGDNIPDKIDIIYKQILYIYDLLFADEDLIEDYGYDGVHFPTEFFELLKQLLNININGQYLFYIK